MFYFLRPAIAVLALTLFSMLIFSQNNEPVSELIADRYIITFKSSATLIDPPNPSNKVPMGQHSSGQSKETLAQTLGLNGEILNIFAGSNVIYVHIDAQEAERWRQDERVEMVEQDMTTVAMLSPEYENERIAHYSDGVLKVPVVDTDAQPALFQDGEFVFDASINAWRLTSFRVTSVIAGMVTNVALIKTNTNPVQVFLEISGSMGGCGSRSKTGLRKTGTRFDVAIGYIPSPGDTVCAAVMTPFEETIQLPVFGLSAGIYEYNVNGEFTGSFELTGDNTL